MAAEFTFGLRYEAIPSDVIAAARRHLADTLACALGAVKTPTVRALAKHALTRGGRAEATLLGTDKKVPAPAAGRVNGAMVRYLDANDIFIDSRGGPSGHFSDATAGLLALAERHRRSAKELLACLVASYEIQGALAQSVDFWQRGLHAATNVSWCTPIVAARLIGATPAEAVHACGLSAASGSLLNTWIRPGKTVPNIKSVAVGLALERALEAADLAALGITANEDALEEILSPANAALPFRFDPAPFAGLGRRWTMPRNMIKRYPAQLHTQAAVEACLRLRQTGIRPEQVQKLTLHGHRHVCGGVQGSRAAFAPSSRETADHSTPYVMAMALLRGRLTSREYEGAPWKSAAVKSAMAKIKLVIDPEMDRAFNSKGILGVRLVAQLRGGGSEEIVIRQPKGHPDASLSDSELVEKLTWLLGTAPQIVPPRLLELCNRMSTAEDLSRLFDLWRFEK